LRAATRKQDQEKDFRQDTGEIGATAARGAAGLTAASFAAFCLSFWPEVTNGPFLSHKGTEREHRCGGVAEFRRKRRLSLRTALTGSATTLRIAENWQPIVSLGHHASPVPPMSAYA
jgi:hypothetical protein